ncbi:peptidase U32 family protein [Viridibacillus sp. FSL R5-0477]|uniref:Peptidase, U32 family protein n=1 Tax=Viridibacillus arenosi FSL R5-213 TaxID=1227360 RepID=W4EP86_9BACL|nr:MULTISPECIES: peptidase U32 family protein [Viridibacillus]ETT82395.1 Peptidase, U32 family protein [Viridibacillus arenosi FSL R5-213]OMC85374.1 peptidase U32 [Viridibacillus sp. FSL H8-0123]OMC87348.1 peptidase U32 [Viridibacillus sp. FSL H7-0596]OMC92509.1 peptidase U32 [Viridibacillus arenosi]
MKKPELLVTPQSVEHVEALIQAGADAFLIGEQQFGLRLAGEFSIEQVAAATEKIHAAGKKVYVAMNAIFHNDRVDALAPYMRKLAEIGVDAIVFGDPAMIIARREAEVTIPLHWSPETIATNWFQADYWGKRGATRTVLARELSMDEVIEIKENTKFEIEVQVHGMTCMFQSKRSLLGNYFLYQDKAMEVENRKENRNMFLHDDERNNKYPIYEDLNGTHIFSPNDLCIIDELDELFEAGIDSFKIEGVLQSPEYVVTVTKCYRKAIDAYAESADSYFDIKNDLLAKIEEIQPAIRPLDTGFYFKETVY